MYVECLKMLGLVFSWYTGAATSLGWAVLFFYLLPREIAL